METTRLIIKALKIVIGLSVFALIVMVGGLDGVPNDSIGNAYLLIGGVSLILLSAYKAHNYCAEWYQAELDRAFYRQQKRKG